MADYYVCEVENKSGKWVINKLINKADYYEMLSQGSSSKSNTTVDADILDSNDKILDIKLKDLEIRSNDLDENVKGYKELMIQTENSLLEDPAQATAAKAYSGLNRYAVASYATTYATNYNPSYGAWPQDCTNFTSQAIYAGGVPQTSYWQPGSYAWIRVEDFKTYMVNNGYASVYSINSQNGITDTISLGDVIQFRYSYSPSYSHGAIATQCHDTYGWLLCAHTNDRLNYPLSMYFGSYSYARSIHFW